ncbi:hypothetical protein [Clostridiisalibacter paucivorans]|uniref:hypothetical protein n=1 Tax=Clostridiisalibacter paucivorans TaxID=408753 RepID=UPI00047968D9|nr:hypothetical protein [Clostridiisalibacter paucivorans]
MNKRMVPIEDESIEIAHEHEPELESQFIGCGGSNLLLWIFFIVIILFLCGGSGFWCLDR